MNFIQPTVGQWYLCRDTGRLFEVVSADDDETIELQDYEGNFDEVEDGVWSTLHLDAVDPPEDLSVFDSAAGEVDGSDDDDLDNGIVETRRSMREAR
jgi:hypothetical protein